MVLEKIRQVIEFNKITLDEFAEKIGEKPTRLKDVLRGKQRPPLEMIQSIVENFQIDANWLIGKGGNFHPIEEIDKDEYAYIPMYDVEVSAGNGAAAMEWQNRPTTWLIAKTGLSYAACSPKTSIALPHEETAWSPPFIVKTHSW